MQIRSLLVVSALTACALLAGCEAVFRDISGEHPGAVGSECELLVPMRAHGVTNKLERDKKTDLVSIWDPGFTGPEVTFVVVLEPGTRVRVLAVRECVNCLGARVSYRVAVTPEPPEFDSKPAFVRAESFTTRQFRCGNGVRPNNSFKPKPLRGSA